MIKNHTTKSAIKNPEMVNLKQFKPKYRQLKAWLMYNKVIEKQIWLIATMKYE